MPLEPKTKPRQPPRPQQAPVDSESQVSQITVEGHCWNDKPPARGCPTQKPAIGQHLAENLGVEQSARELFEGATVAAEDGAAFLVFRLLYNAGLVESTVNTAVWKVRD